MMQWRIRSVTYANGSQSHFVERRYFHPNDVKTSIWEGVGGAHSTYSFAKGYLDSVRVVKEVITEL